MQAAVLLTTPPSGDIYARRSSGGCWNPRTRRGSDQRSSWERITSPVPKTGTDKRDGQSRLPGHGGGPGWILSSCGGNPDYRCRSSTGVVAASLPVRRHLTTRDLDSEGLVLHL